MMFESKLSERQKKKSQSSTKDELNARISSKRDAGDPEDVLKPGAILMNKVTLQ